MKKVCNLSMIAVLALMLLIPVLCINWKPEQISLIENRPLAEPVPLTQGVSNFMTGLDQSLNDRIGFREEMVSCYNRMNVELFRTGNDNVILGKDGWLFYKDELPDYTGKTADPAVADYYVQILVALDQKCKERGTQFVFMPCPNKSSVYAQYMPDTIRKADVTLLDMILERLEDTDVVVICPKEAMIADSEKQELYMRLDTHWNSYGAKYALDDLVDALGLPEKTFSVSGSYIYGGDLLNMLAVPTVGSRSVYASVTPDPDTVRQTIPGTKHITLSSEDGASFVCYRDSYSIALENYYTHYFQGTMYWNSEVLEAFRQEPTDYLILECVERYLFNLERSAAILETEEISN